MRSLLLSMAVCLVLGSLSAPAQSSTVYNRLRMIIAGKADEVRTELPDLMKEFPDDPGVMYLNAVLTEDGAKALNLYEQITREHPQSEWADDAELRIVQYYALKRDTVRAQRELSTFKRNYPLSEFLLHAMELVKSTVGLAAPTTAKLVDKNAAPSKGAKENLLVESKPNDAKTTKTAPTATSAAPATSADKSSTDTPAKKYWGLQVGVYAAKKTADAEAQKYRDLRMKVDVQTKDGKFSVVVGNYSSRESADKSKDIIQAQCQCSPLVVEK